MIDQSGKIEALEQELEKLRQQISTILSRPSERPLTPPSTPVPPAPPPPPPPPPPPLPVYSTNGKKCLKDHISRVDSKLILKETNRENDKLPSKNEPVSMSDVLKGLNKVKLKRTAR